MDNQGNKKIKSVLISLFYKEPAKALIEKLHNLDVKIYSTGGTLDYIRKLNIPATPVEDITDYPSIFGGRVKTLHPKIFGGILYRRDNTSDLKERDLYDVPSIDMVIVDLYPFEQTVDMGASMEDVIEKIDIGGISLIRAAAKNFSHTWVVPSSQYYREALSILEEMGSITNTAQRKQFAAYAFHISSHYDTLIYQYLTPDPDLYFKKSIEKSKTLRYGENPHQKGFFFGDLGHVFTQLHGKEISYNNLLDIESALSLIAEFDDPTFAIIKHTNACGVATRKTIDMAYHDALASDPVSAFGGILIANRNIDQKTAYHIHELFFEVILAPDFSTEALEILKQKKNRIILRITNTIHEPYQFRSLLNGILIQSVNHAQTPPESWTNATKKQPDNETTEDLIFANKLVKHTKSNAIVLAKNKQLIASGVGQTSRVDALKQAIAKAKDFKHTLHNAVMASDAFFPFADSVEIAASEGIKAVIQPGGSVRDKDSVDSCNKNDMVMVFTGVRHFKH
ncbi:MAG: bifunctional phosphoribosylaminoimidazolecarboxamide formyltransferase/IMP cyclohydrolase [Bacteroidota bacterium]